MKIEAHKLSDIERSFLPSFRFILLANETSLHICFYIVRHLYPPNKSVAREMFTYTVKSWMPYSLYIKMLFQKLLLKTISLQHIELSAFSIEKTLIKPILKYSSLLDLLHQLGVLGVHICHFFDKRM